MVGAVVRSPRPTFRRPSHDVWCQQMAEAGTYYKEGIYASLGVISIHTPIVGATINQLETAARPLQ